MIISKFQKSSASDQSVDKIVDEITVKKIHQHLSDEKDLITEEDIKNAKTDFLRDTAIPAILPNFENAKAVQQQKGLQSTEKNENNERETVTPWNVLN